MTRTLISIPQELKIWLDDYSKKNNKPTAETIREAIKAFRNKMEMESKVDLLSQTSGLWKDKHLNSIDYVESLRNEW
ncbi:MAG: hypothetical protein KKF62_18125 [Bacteroidetes bacterium]|nr:hypothetical protein [Bacteroidota bacterium]MBU1116502.1 hypothetical protein [Bacteroidota bacterium]MBU1797156.1 hypothetical protein [Bacteroidota bacterium]